MRLREAEQLKEEERRGGVARGGGEGDDEDRLDGVLVRVRLRVRVRVRVRLTLTLTLTLSAELSGGVAGWRGGGVPRGGVARRCHLQLAEDLHGGARQHGAHEAREAVRGRGEHVEGHRPEDEQLET